MGFFNKMFSGRKEVAQLDAASPAARRLAEKRSELEELTREIKDNLEIVPGSERTWVFVGKPPKRFGLVWIEGSEVKNLKTLVDEKGIGPDRMSRIVDDLREAYLHAEDEPRFDTEVAGRHVRVAPSSKLEHQVEEIITRAEM